jgi:magnesium-transporting ATPase (P-type)
MNDEDIVMTGERFREIIGRVQDQWEETTKEYKIDFTEGRSKFEALRKKVKVVARCTPRDKIIFIQGIR